MHAPPLSLPPRRLNSRRPSLIAAGLLAVTASSLVISATMSAAAEPGRPPVAAFESVPFQAGLGLPGVTAGYRAFRIPALVVTNQGTLLAFCEGRKTSLSDDGDVDLVLRRSSDSGRTWEPLQLIHEEGGDSVVTIGNPCAVVDRSTGVVWLMMNRENGRVLVTSSTDDGATWAEPRDVTKEVSQPDWGWYALGPGCGIQLTTAAGPYSRPGRLIIPANHRTTADRSGPSSSHVIYSDDHGNTWQIGGTVGLHTNECQVAELGDGRLLINCRNHWGTSGKRPELALKRVQAESRDGGATWQPPTFAEALVEPTCQAGLIRLSKLATEGRARLAFTNPASTKARERMTLKLSEDDGRTWPAEKQLVLHEGSSAYSSPAELKNEMIGVLYERNRMREIAFCAVDIGEPD
ncbi:MAG: sialidase family protein [Pirellulales bacterium]